MVRLLKMQMKISPCFINPMLVLAKEGSPAFLFLFCHVAGLNR